VSDAEYQIHRGVGKPPPHPGRQSRWDLPLSKLREGDMLLLPMSLGDAKERVNAARSYANREGKKLGCKFSVFAKAVGIEIWR
tara:strand:+ start:7725 stop:7973 length:249 start_codon:yes stop_codon:yes gene_type:complete